MNEKQECPLCGDLESELLELVNSNDVNKLYAKIFDIHNALKSSQLEYRECSKCSLKFFWPMETGGELLYEQLQTNDWYYMTDKQEYKIASSFVGTVKSVLEVGAGKAAFSSIVKATHYTGLEFNDLAIKRAHKAGIDLIKETVEDHAKVAERYDAVVSFQVLEHVDSPRSFIESCIKCLKPNGILILAVPSHDGFGGEMINSILDMPPHHVSHWTEKSFTFLEKLFDVEVVAIEHEPVSVYHRKLAYKTQIEAAVRNSLGLKYSLIDQTIISRIVAKLANAYVKLSKKQAKYTKGHTMVGVFRKV